MPGGVNHAISKWITRWQAFLNVSPCHISNEKKLSKQNGTAKTNDLLDPSEANEQRFILRRVATLTHPIEGSSVWRTESPDVCTVSKPVVNAVDSRRCCSCSW
jgi:hypothetical protein